MLGFLCFGRAFMSPTVAPAGASLPIPSGRHLAPAISTPAGAGLTIPSGGHPAPSTTRSTDNNLGNIHLNPVLYGGCGIANIPYLRKEETTPWL